MNGKTFISSGIIKGAAIFQCFKAHVTFNMATGLGTFCGVFFVMCCLWLLKGQRHFCGALCRKWGQVQNWGKAAKESILPAAGTVLNEAANRVKQGGNGKRKRKKLQYIRHRPEERTESTRILKQTMILKWSIFSNKFSKNI